MSGPRDGVMIRRFRPEGQAAARDLILAGMKEHRGFLDPSMNPDLDDIVAAYASSTFLLAWFGEELLGTGALVREMEGIGRIVRMSVAARTRRRGVGRLILKALLEYARTAGYHRVVLETEEDWSDAITFYRNCGFRAIGYQDGAQMVIDFTW